MLAFRSSISKIVRNNKVVIRSLSTVPTQEYVAPDLKGLEKRWPKMKELDQADVIDYLNWKAQEDWKLLTSTEKRCLYYIYFGNWGPRALEPQTSISGTVLKGLFGGVLAIALGVTAMNYGYDLEREAKVERLLQRIEKEK